MRLVPAVFVAAWCVVAAVPVPAWAGITAHLRQSVVKIHVNMQHEDYLQPWQARGIGGGSGTGFVISRKRILTNAHVVSDARFIEVEREGDSQRYPAAVAFAGHDCDLAILTVEDEALFRNTKALAFHSRLPTLNDEVIAVGYPIGGDRISLTRGVVSRIDHNVYAHSGVDAHLVMQVDAAINPGNSGGPVLFQNKVVGLAFQGLADSQNIGYAIPLPVIDHFLRDIEDGAYHGYPELGVAFMDTRNPALRQALKLADAQSGVVLYYIDPYGSAQSRLRAGDVLMAMDGHPVANDGSIELEGNHVDFTELLERKQWSESVSCSIWRTGAVSQVSIPLNNPADPFAYRNLYDQRPEFIVVQGLVFTPLTRNYLTAMGTDLNNATAHNLLYSSQFAKIDNLHTNRTQFVVLINRLPHPVNTYSQEYISRIVQEANGKAIGSLIELAEALETPLGEFHVIRFEGSDNPLILNAAITARADREIKMQYRLPALRNLSQKADSAHIPNQTFQVPDNPAQSDE